MILQPLKVQLHLEGHTPVARVPNYSRLCMNPHLHRYLHLSAATPLSGHVQPANVKFGLRDL
jgi:hypothetical protein